MYQGGLSLPLRPFGDRDSIFQSDDLQAETPRGTFPPPLSQDAIWFGCEIEYSSLCLHLVGYGALQTSHFRRDRKINLGSAMMSVTKMATRRFSHVVGSRSHPALPLSFYSGREVVGGREGGRTLLARRQTVMQNRLRPGREEREASNEKTKKLPHRITNRKENEIRVLIFHGSNLRAGNKGSGRRLEREARSEEAGTGKVVRQRLSYTLAAEFQHQTM